MTAICSNSPLPPSARLLGTTRRSLPRPSSFSPNHLLPLSLTLLPCAHRRHGGPFGRKGPSIPISLDNERPVPCEVEGVSWRERRVRACVSVYADVEDVWRVLTDYERLADFIPNLVYSGKVECPHEGRVWLEQRGVQRALYWHIEARVVLDLQETRKSANERELHFSMVDGDFKKFEGKWSVKAVPRSSTTLLSYEVCVIPKFNFPAMFIERIIRSDLPVNLRALAWRAEGSATGVQYQPASANVNDPDFGVHKGIAAAISQKNNFSLKNLHGEHIGSDSRTFPTSQTLRNNWGVFGKFCRLDRPCMIDEVHLRRFDGLLENGGVHRGVVASITVKAPVSDVWNVLTAYEKLPEIVPNLAISKVMLRENNKVRILQEGCKGLLYMVLHARVILDLYEKHEQEISFEQVEGDFESFTGKWILEKLGDHHTRLKYVIESKIHTDTFLLEAIVEEVIYEDLPSNLCAIRDYVENGLSMDLEGPVPSSSQIVPADHEVRLEEKWPLKMSVSTIPNKKSQVYPSENEVHIGETWPSKISSYSPSPTRNKTKVPGLQRDINVLKSELLLFISEHGQEGYMPMRKQLRLQGRVDIEKAITRMGGFRKIANLMNLSLAYKHRKPKGYWDNLDNLQQEISRFQRNWGMDPSYMPSRKSLERAGRYDIARALEKWGGLQEVSRLLSLELRYPRKQLDSDSKKDKDNSHLNHKNSQSKAAGKSFDSQETDQWLLKFKDLELNWLE